MWVSLSLPVGEEQEEGGLPFCSRETVRGHESETLLKTRGSVGQEEKS